MVYVCMVCLHAVVAVGVCWCNAGNSLHPSSPLAPPPCPVLACDGQHTLLIALRACMHACICLIAQQQAEAAAEAASQPASSTQSCCCHKQFDVDCRACARQMQATQCSLLRHWCWPAPWLLKVLSLTSSRTRSTGRHSRAHVRNAARWSRWHTPLKGIRPHFAFQHTDRKKHPAISNQAASRLLANPRCTRDPETASTPLLLTE